MCFFAFSQTKVVEEMRRDPASILISSSSDLIAWGLEAR